MDQVVNKTLENITASVTNATAGSFGGQIIAYGTLYIMAIIPIYIGAIKAFHNLIKNDEKKHDKMETISSKDAAMFPLYASMFLFGIYLIFKVLTKDYINSAVSLYFFWIGIFTLAHILNPILNRVIPDFESNQNYHLTLQSFPCASTLKTDESTSNSNPLHTIFDFFINKKDFVGFGIAITTGIWYYYTKHWLPNNLFGLTFAVNAIELIHLNKVRTGCILLGGLFFYDIFWVFGTDVMLTVATSFDAPIKVVFPKDILYDGFFSKQLAMLGLGDIVIPGIFISMMLRFDHSIRPNGRRIYFISGLVAYTTGLIITIAVMHIYKHGQPALLYLVPTCLGFPIAMAIVKGELIQLFNYEDAPSNEEDEENVVESEAKKDN